MGEASSDPLFDRFGQVCPPGTVLFRDGEQGSKMYVLRAGKVAIRKEVRGREKTLAVLGPGEFFGEMAILNKKPRTATAEVLEESRLLMLDAQTFEQMVVSNAEIAVRLIKRLARRLDAADSLIEILMHRDPKARVILGLSRESSVIGQPQADGAVLIPLTLAELGKQVGLGEEEVGDVFRRLSRLGIVEHTETGLLVRDQERLHEFLEFLEMQDQFEET
ncbi:MAG: Crp/Fnr family transcriptional regulator [Myxococcota bacterium]